MPVKSICLMIATLFLLAALHSHSSVLAQVPTAFFSTPEFAAAKRFKLPPPKYKDTVEYQFGTLGHFRPSTLFIEFTCKYKQYDCHLLNSTGWYEETDSRVITENDKRIMQACIPNITIADFNPHFPPIQCVNILKELESTKYESNPTLVAPYKPIVCSVVPAPPIGRKKRVAPTNETSTVAAGAGGPTPNTPVPEGEFCVAKANPNVNQNDPTKKQKRYKPIMIAPCRPKACAIDDKFVCYEEMGVSRNGPMGVQRLVGAGKKEADKKQTNKAVMCFIIKEYTTKYLADLTSKGGQAVCTGTKPEVSTSYGFCLADDHPSSYDKTKGIFNAAGQPLVYDPIEADALPLYQVWNGAKCPKDLQEIGDFDSVFPLQIDGENLYIGELRIIGKGQSLQLMPRPGVTNCSSPSVQCFYKTWTDGEDVTSPTTNKMTELDIGNSANCLKGWRIKGGEEKNGGTIPEIAKFEYSYDFFAKRQRTLIGCYEEKGSEVRSFEFFVEQDHTTLAKDEGRQCTYGDEKKFSAKKVGAGCICEKHIYTCNPVRRLNIIKTEKYDKCEEVVPTDWRPYAIGGGVLALIGLLVLVVVCLVMRKPKQQPISVTVQQDDPMYQQPTGIDSGVNSLAPGAESVVGDPSVAGTGSDAAPDFMTATSEQPNP